MVKVLVAATAVFPTPAGINRVTGSRLCRGAGVPRASGDKPGITDAPYQRGAVFPAPAGINLTFTLSNDDDERVPRASGDKPSTVRAFRLFT
ncbi:hypothetical protein IFV70_000212 [Salmonella enterica]|nr:hypothetical protein [Salmonella enterica]